MLKKKENNKTYVIGYFLIKMGTSFYVYMHC